MKSFRIAAIQFTVLLLSIHISFGQDSTVISYPGFKMLRASEDYSFLKGKSTAPTFWEKLKYIPLHENSFLSLGGDFRSEFQVLQNEEWIKNNDDAPLYLRFMFHTDLHLGKRFRLFTQLKSGHSIGRNGPPFFLNVDRLDFHQLFASFQFGNSKIEVGRRELFYGSRRLISIREGTNVRQSFDGARYIWQKDNHQLDVLLYAYNPQRTGVFDNDFNTDQLLWGTYYVWNATKDQVLNFDLYYLGINHENPRFEEGSLEETRHSFGIRNWGTIGRLSYNNEFVLQRGSFGDGSINAWTISTDLSFKFPGNVGFKPGLKAEIISGDKDPEDGDLQTFNALYPRGGYFGLLAVVGPANLVDIHPSLGFNLFSSVSVMLDWDFFWRHQLGDGIYFPSGRLNIAGSESNERFIGHQAGIQVGRPINRFLEVEVSYFYFFSGPFIKDVTDGVNFSQFGTSINYKF
ncbi:MAG: alginate export family protein [Bacteroidota bacterium]